MMFWWLFLHTGKREGRWEGRKAGGMEGVEGKGGRDGGGRDG